MEGSNKNSRAGAKKRVPSSSSPPSSRPSIVDEIFGHNDAATPTSGAAGSGSYFSSVFPPASSVIGKELSHSRVCWTINKHRNEGSSGYGDSNRRQVTYKDGKPVYYNEQTESPYFGSSVHYGGRDFYTSTSSKQTSETSKTQYKPDENDPNAATRGDWWQGSLYY